MIHEISEIKSNVPTANVLNLSSNLNCSQFVQHYGSVALPSNVEGGFYTDARGEVRRSADQKAQRQIQKLNASINIMYQCAKLDIFLKSYFQYKLFRLLMK